MTGLPLAELRWCPGCLRLIRLDPLTSTFKPKAKRGIMGSREGRIGAIAKRDSSAAE